MAHLLIRLFTYLFIHSSALLFLFLSLSIFHHQQGREYGNNRLDVEIHDVKRHV